MIGQRFAIEATLETQDGPRSASQQVREAMNASGLVLLVSIAHSHLLPGEELAQSQGRPVLSTVEVHVETLVELDADALIEIVFTTLRERGSTVTGVSVGGVPREP